MWYVSMDVMVIYVQKWAKKNKKVLHSLVWLFMSQNLELTGLRHVYSIAYKEVTSLA